MTQQKEAGQRWRTRGGRETTITSIGCDVFPTWPVHFQIDGNGHTCRHDGRVINDEYEHQHDLLERIDA